MKAIALKNTYDETEKSKIKDITQNVLLSWGVLTEKDGKILPTNAYALLTGQHTYQPYIQCGLFKGKDRSVFLDRKEFTGPIQDQVEQAFEYVLQRINCGIEIVGVYRKDVYELPIGSIRELIANSVAHRSYLEPGNIQVALYDDRLEVTSPGMLLNGVSIEKMKEGYSKIRNRAIANAFAYMKIIEKWGSGIPKVIRECEEYSLPEPMFINFDGDVRVNMYRKDTNGNNGIKPNDTNDTNDTKNDTNDTIALKLIREDPTITQVELKDKMQVSLITVKRIMSSLQKEGKIKRKGSSRNGTWIIIGKK